MIYFRIKGKGLQKKKKKWEKKKKRKKKQACEIVPKRLQKAVLVLRRIYVQKSRVN